MVSWVRGNISLQVFNTVSGYNSKRKKNRNSISVVFADRQKHFIILLKPNMKKIFTISLMLLFSYTSHSQILISILLGDKLNSDKLEFGLDGGLNMSNISGLSNADQANRFNLGFYFDIKFKKSPWFFNTGVMVKSTMGAQNLAVYDLHNSDLNNTFVGGSVNRRLSYFNVPLLIKYKFKNNFSVKAGPMLGLMNKSLDVFTNKVKDKEDLTYKLKIRDQYHPIDAGLLFGLEYRLLGGNGMNLGVRYYLGLVDITVEDDLPNQYNRSLYFSVGIPIGKAPKAK
jgi:hypothetical protein